MSAKRPKKTKRDNIFEILPKEKEVLLKYDEIVQQVRSFDPNLAEDLGTLSKMFDCLVNLPSPSLQHYAATELTEPEACEITGVKFSWSLEHQWKLKDSESQPDVQLSPPIGRLFH